MTEETFSLNGDPRQNYVNLILNDMKNYNFWKENRKFTESVRALDILLLDLPPAGQEYLKGEIDVIFAFEKNVNSISTWAELNRMYQKTMGWVWPNILQEYFTAKPRNPQPMTLGE
jgi:hypothetical protein